MREKVEVERSHDEDFRLGASSPPQSLSFDLFRQKVPGLMPSAPETAPRRRPAARRRIAIERPGAGLREREAQRELVLTEKREQGVRGGMEASDTCLKEVRAL